MMRLLPEEVADTPSYATIVGAEGSNKQETTSVPVLTMQLEIQKYLEQAMKPFTAQLAEITTLQEQMKLIELTVATVKTDQEKLHSMEERMTNRIDEHSIGMNDQCEQLKALLLGDSKQSSLEVTMQSEVQHYVDQEMQQWKKQLDELKPSKKLDEIAPLQEKVQTLERTVQTVKTGLDDLNSQVDDKLEKTLESVDNRCTQTIEGMEDQYIEYENQMADILDDHENHVQDMLFAQLEQLNGILTKQSTQSKTRSEILNETPRETSEPPRIGSTTAT
jgi:hypothetical protein